MASQVLDLGADAFGGGGNWEGAILVDPALIDGGGTAYLRQFRLIANSAIVRLAASPDADPEDAGPEFTEAFETANEAFTLAEAGGGAALVLKGPAHSDNLFPDSSEVYYWTPDNGAAWHEWVLGTGSGVVTLTLDDGQAPPPPPAISISATFDGAAGSLSLALTKRSLLTLADFASSGLDLDVLALIEVGAPAIYGTAPRPVSGALLDGELGMGATDEPIVQLRFAGGTITLNDNGPLAMSDYWANGGPGDDLTLHLQTEQGHISFPVAGNRGNAGGNYVVFNVPAEQQAFVAGIVEGERLLFAFTRAAAAAKPIAAAFAAAAANLAAALTKRTPGTQPIAATYAGAPGSVSLALTKRSRVAKPIAATFAARAAALAAALTKRTPGTQPIAATYAGAPGSVSLALAKRSRVTKPIAATFAATAAALAAALTKRTPGTQPIAATTFAARAATLSAAISKSARLSESARRRIRSTSGSWDGVRVGDLVAVGRATSYTRDVEVAAVRHDDRNVRLTLVDYPETLYAGELPLGDFRPGDSIPGPYLGPACPVIRSIHTGVDDVGQDRAGTNPILLRIEIEPDDSSRPAARTYIVQCRQATVAGTKPTATEDDDPVLQGQPDDEYYEQPGTDWQDCGVVERPGVGTLILSSGFSIGERIDIRVIALDDEGRASCWRVYEDYLVELPVAAAPGARLHFGEIDPEAAPDDAIGQDGDRFIADDGRTWVKVDGAWVFQGDFTSEGTKIHSGEVAEDALPPGDIGTIGDLYFAFDGRWWEKTDETTWTPRGDLTGPAGSDIFTGSGEPQAGQGKDGDVYVRDDGTVWRKAGGVWTQTGVDLTGPGTKLYTGEVADGAKPPAGTGKVGDVFLASDGRFWEKTAAATWTLRGDLTGPAGSNIFTGSGERRQGRARTATSTCATTAPSGARPAASGPRPASTSPASRLQSSSAARWPTGRSPPRAPAPSTTSSSPTTAASGRRTAAATWTLRGDLTGPAGSGIFTGSGEPQPALGKDGDVYVRDDGTVWRKAGGVWTQTGVDLTGKPASKLFSGEVADGAKPPAGTGNVDDFFLASDGRFWEKTAAATWTLRGDLTGPAGSGIFTGSGEPQPALGKDGDVYVRDDGTVWRKAGGVWTQTGVDLTGKPASKLFSGEVADGAKPPAGTGNVDDFFLASDGRFWEKTATATWTLRGDLTGPAGSNTFTGSGEPQPALGKDGDVYVRDDGTLWTRANGVWTYTGVDLTGPPGASLIPGDVSEGQSPDASLGEVGDIFFNLDGRVWEKTDDTTWTSRGDITGPPGASLIPGVVATDALPPANVGNVGDTFLAADGRFWQKTDATTWTYVDDLTGPSGEGGINPRGEWATGNSYAVGDSVFRVTSNPILLGFIGIYITFKASRSYLCKVANTSSSSNAPSGSGNTYWDAITGHTSLDDDSTVVDPTPVVTTTSVTRYQLASSRPATPPSSTENPPSGWSVAQPPQHATLSIYKLVGTRTYDDDVFRSSVWAVTFVQGPSGSVVTTTTVTRYQLASSTPATPPSSTENPPAGWGRVAQPPQHATLSIYKLVGTRTYDGDVFRSAVWAVTFVRGPSGSVVTTTTVTRYQLASSTPATPGSNDENPPSGWSVAQPDPSFTQSTYKLVGTRTYDDDVFRSSVWAVTFVRGPIVVFNTFEYVYRLSVGTPLSPLGGTSTENHIPANWFALANKPSPTLTQGVYQSSRSTRYEDDVFIRATAWRTPTLYEGNTGGLFAPGAVRVSATITTVLGTVVKLVSGSWNGVVGAAGGYGLPA